MQIPFVGMQPIKTSEHMASAGECCYCNVKGSVVNDIQTELNFIISYAVPKAKLTRINCQYNNNKKLILLR